MHSIHRLKEFKIGAGAISNFDSIVTYLKFKNEIVKLVQIARGLTPRLMALSRLKPQSLPTLQATGLN